MPFLESEGSFWPLTASMTSEFKNNYAYVITQDNCNKFIEVNFCAECMVSQPNRLLQHSTMSLINKKTLLNLLPIFSNKSNRLDIGSQEVQGHTLVQQALLVVMTSLFSNSLFLTKAAF